MKNARILSRLIWYHVPPTLTPYTAEDKALDKTARRSAQEADRVMMEKNMALDLIEGYVCLLGVAKALRLAARFAVALKHHLRGESQILLSFTIDTGLGEPTMYHEDLYHLLTPMHDVGLFSSRRTIPDLHTISIDTPSNVQLWPQQWLYSPRKLTLLALRHQREPHRNRHN